MVNKSVKKKTSFKGDSNPFNMKLNREKHCVLGKRMKGTRGLRCISQAESMLRRKEAFHKKRNTLSKANNFKDKRLMTGDSAEDIAVSRLVHERKNKLKKNIFNLNEEDFLTHEGVRLEDIEVFDTAKGSDDEDDLSTAYVQKAHFGGGADPAGGDGSSKPPSHKEVIDQMIAESKQKKNELRAERDLTSSLIDKLDQEWKSVHGSAKIRGEPARPVPTKNDGYDLVAQQLKFSARGTATSRTKTEEEIRAEKEEKRLQLEKERLRRMLGEDDGKSRRSGPADHLSADSICDDFVYEPIVSGVDDGEVGDDTKTDDNDSEEDEEDLGPNHESDDEGSEGEDGDEGDESASEGDELNHNDSKDMEDNLAEFNVPKNIDELERYMDKHKYTFETCHVGVEELLRPIMNSKSEKKLDRLAKFFSSLIEYALKHMHTRPCVSQNIAPCLFQIAEISPLKCAEIFLNFVDEMQEEFQESKEKKNRCRFRIERAILLFKYCSVLYSVSDFKHPVVTPSLLFMSDILSTDFQMTYLNVVGRLSICHIVLNCVSQSRRLVPEAVVFLKKIVSLAVPGEAAKRPKKKNRKSFSLLLSEKHVSGDVAELNLLQPQKSCGSSMKAGMVLCALQLLQRFAQLYSDLPSFSEIFSEAWSLCSRLDSELYPPGVREAVDEFGRLVTSGGGRGRFSLSYVRVKPVPLKTFEPNFDSKFTKTDVVRKQFRELKQVGRKIRKEEKCLQREIRRDAQVVASEKLKERIEADVERKRKVQELCHDLAVQQGDFNKYMKLKEKF